MSRDHVDQLDVWNFISFYVDADHANDMAVALFANAFTLTPYNGTEALVWLFHQKPESLNPLVKYLSATTGFGSNYVTSKKMDLDEDTAEKCYQNLLELEKHVRVTIKKTDNQS